MNTIYWHLRRSNKISLCGGVDFVMTQQEAASCEDSESRQKLEKCDKRIPDLRKIKTSPHAAPPREGEKGNTQGYPLALPGS